MLVCRVGVYTRTYKENDMYKLRNKIYVCHFKLIVMLWKLLLRDHQASVSVHVAGQYWWSRTLMVRVDMGDDHCLGFTVYDRWCLSDKCGGLWPSWDADDYAVTMPSSDDSDAWIAFHRAPLWKKIILAIRG